MEKIKLMEPRFRIFGTLFLISNRLEVIGNQYLKELTSKQWLLMAVLSVFDEPPGISRLAGFMGSSHQNVKQLCLRLEEKGFVKLEKDGQDGRKQLVVPTKKAIHYGESRTKKDELFIDRLFKGIKKEQTDSFLQCLDQLNENLMAMQAEQVEGE